VTSGRDRAVAHITASGDTYLNGEGLAPGVYVDRGAIAGLIVVGENSRRLIVADVAGSLWFGGVEVTDPDALDLLAQSLGSYADRMRTRSEK
jgi:hypothetical protein